MTGVTFGLDPGRLHKSTLGCAAGRVRGMAAQAAAHFARRRLPFGNALMPMVPKLTTLSALPAPAVVRQDNGLLGDVAFGSNCSVAFQAVRVTDREL